MSGPPPPRRATQGIQRVCKHEDLVVWFLAQPKLRRSPPAVAARFRQHDLMGRGRTNSTASCSATAGPARAAIRALVAAGGRRETGSSTTVAPTTSTVPPLMAEELAWVKAVTTLHERMD
jgi:hypothetical protein